MNKIAVFSDIHGNNFALKAILEDIYREGIKKIVCTGDVIGIGPAPNQCIDLLKEYHVKVSLGNNEIGVLRNATTDGIMNEEEKPHLDWIRSQITNENLTYMKTWPLGYDLDIHNQRYLFAHYAFDKKQFKSEQILTKQTVNEVFSEEIKKEYDYIFFGHEHTRDQLVYKGCHYIGIGSSGCIPSNYTYYTIVDPDRKPCTITKKEIPYHRNSFIKEAHQIEYPEGDYLLKTFFNIH